MLKILSNISFGYGLIISIIVIYQRIAAFQNGSACPVNDQRPWIYSAIFAALLSLLLGYFDGRSKRPKQ